MIKVHYNFILRFSLNFVVFLGMAFTSFPALPAGRTQPSIISLDYCADQYALMLADREQIIAVSKSAEDLFSYYRGRAKDIRKTNSSLEQVMMLKPDFALQTYRVAVHLDEMAERTDISLIQTHFGSDPETVKKNIRMVGNALGQPERANEFLKSFQDRLERLKVNPSRKLRIVYVTPGGVTAGMGTSVDEIIKLSGYENYMESHRLRGWVNIPLELLISDPPDIFLTSFFDRDEITQSRWSLSRHDYLFKMMDEIPTINIPSALMSCGGLFHVDAAELIREQIRAENE